MSDNTKIISAIAMMIILGALFLLMIKSLKPENTRMQTSPTNTEATNIWIW